MRIDKYTMAQSWMRQDDATPEEAKATWDILETEFEDKRKSWLMASAETDEIIKTINDKFGPGTLFPASEAPIPPKTLDRDMWESANERLGFNDGQLVTPNPDGSRPGYGGKRKTSTEGLPQFVTTDEVNPGKYTVRVKGSKLNEPFFKQNLSLEEATKLAKKYKPAYTIDTDLLSQLIEQANNSNKIYSKEDIMEMYAKKKKTVGTTKRKTSYGDIKTYPKIKTKTFDSAGTLLSQEQKVERVLQEILSMDEAVPNIDLGARANKNLPHYKKHIINETGIGEVKLNKILKTLPDFKNNLESFTYLGNSGLWKTDLVEMSLSDQLKWAFDAKEGKPRYKNIGYLVGDPNYVAMDFALRNWNQNKGKGKIKFYDANGDIIKWKNGLELPVTKVTFNYEGNRFGIGKKDNALNLRLVGKDYFPEVYKNLDYINQLKATMVDNPYKPGKQISFMDLMKRVYIKDKGYKAGAPLFSIFHGEGGVGKEPFKNLSFGMQDLNQALYKIEKTIPLKGLRKKITNQAIGNLKGLGGEDLIEAIINQQSAIAQEAAKGKLPIGTVRDRAILEVAKDKTLGPKERKIINQLTGGDPKLNKFVSQNFMSSGFAGAYELLSDDLKKIVNSKAFKTWEAKIANPALKGAMGTAKLGSKIFGVADLALGYLDYSNNRQKGWSKEDSIAHMTDTMLFGITNKGEQADMAGVKKVAMEKYNMSSEVFDGLVSANKNQNEVQNIITNFAALNKQSEDLIASGMGDKSIEYGILEKEKKDSQERLKVLMKEAVEREPSLKTNLQIQEAGAPININVDKGKALGDLSKASYDFVQKRIKDSDLEKLASQKDTTKGGIGDTAWNTLQGLWTYPKFAYDVVNPFSPLPEWGGWKTKGMTHKEQMEQLKKEDPTMYYKMLLSEGVDPRMDMNIPVHLEWEQKYPYYGTPISDEIKKSTSYFDGGIASLRRKK